jgi:hypothetical protein
LPHVSVNPFPAIPALQMFTSHVTGVLPVPIQLSKRSPVTYQCQLTSILIRCPTSPNVHQSHDIKQGLHCLSLSTPATDNAPCRAKGPHKRVMSWQYLSDHTPTLETEDSP